MTGERRDYLINGVGQMVTLKEEKNSDRLGA